MAWWKTLGTWALVITILYLVVGISQPAKACPLQEEDPDAQVTIEYLYQPFCVYCWKEDPLIEGLEKEFPEHLHVKRYNIRSCVDKAREYAVTGTPTMVFHGEQGQYIARGFLDEGGLRQVICEIGGICE